MLEIVCCGGLKVVICCCWFYGYIYYLVGCWGEVMDIDVWLIGNCLVDLFV